MADCPQCHAEVDAMSISCEKCGYDFFNLKNSYSDPDDWAYGTFANVALFILSGAAIISILYSVFLLLASIFSLKLGYALGATIALVLSLGQLVIVKRVLDFGEHIKNQRQ